MKICILISGEPRMYEQTYFSLKPLVEYLNADIFIHSWDSVTRPRTNDLQDDTPIVTDRIDSLESKLLNYYNPKDYQIQSKSKIKEFLSEKNIPHIPYDYERYMYSNYGSVGQWYSTQEANRLKQKYEQENNFKYDIQIKTRFDTIFCMQSEEEITKIKDIQLSKIKNKETDVYTPWFHIIDGEVLMEYSTLIGDNKSMDNIWGNIIQDIAFNDIFGHNNPHYSMTKHLQRNVINLKHWEEMNGMFRIVRSVECGKDLHKHWRRGDLKSIKKVIKDGNEKWGL